MAESVDISTITESELEALQRGLAECDLIEFMAQAWHVLEPNSRRFRRGWALEAMCEHLEAVTRGQIRKLLINIVPGATKSMTCNVFWPAWEWGPQNLPHKRYAKFSYNEDLTLRDNRKLRQLVRSEWYQRRWGDRVEITKDSDAKGLFWTTANGFAFASSIGGTTTGERADRLVVDDPHSVQQAESEATREATLRWFSEALSTRTNESESAIIVIMQRVHERDVSGLILEKELGFDHLCLPMEYEADHPHKSRTTLGFVDPRKEDGELLWPERFPRDYIENDLKPMMSAWGGSYAISGQLQQRPTPRGGGMFKRQWFGYWEDRGDHYELQHPDGKVSRVYKRDCWRAAAADTAQSEKVTADYTVRHVADVTPSRDILLLDQYRRQAEAPEVEQEMRRTLTDWHPLMLGIEEKNAGQGTVQRLQGEGLPVLGLKAHTDKVSRAYTAAVMAENGKVFLPKGAAWVETFLEEVCTFPVGAHDDIPDCLSHLVRMVANRDQWRPVLAEFSAVPVDQGGHVESEHTLQEGDPVWVYLRLESVGAALLLTVDRTGALHVLDEVYAASGRAEELAEGVRGMLEAYGRSLDSVRGVYTEPESDRFGRGYAITPGDQMRRVGLSVQTWPSTDESGWQARVDRTRAKLRDRTLRVHERCTRLIGEMRTWRHKTDRVTGNALTEKYEGPDYGVRCLLAWVAGEPQHAEPVIEVMDTAAF